MKRLVYSELLLLIIALFLIALFTRCEDVITVDLENAEPQIVIEGTITDAPGPYTVKITKTTDFYQPSVYEKVSNAVVIIKDSYGNIDSLQENEPGVYYTSIITSSYNETYFLEVIAEGQEYSASTELRTPMILDSISLEQNYDEESRDNIRINVYSQDNPGIKDYQRFRIAINGEFENEYSLYDDRLTDGNYIENSINVDKEDVAPGDTLTVVMSTIDEAAYRYYSTLQEVIGTDGGFSVFSSSPSNPETNLTNEALGFFGAYAISSKTLIVK